ncbi:anhydro-N-acetylmuramic acid kinase [Streptomyces coeruleorubidus]|uniref:anhydro-N-acetylmuramic acid kinase n=1 Tax=Streptomyces coeruleorubidus TaxID=116188 RepID=UPI0036F6251E
MFGPLPPRGVADGTSDGLGPPSEAKEAYAFEVLEFLTPHGLSGTEPASTGARRPSVLGSVTPGRRGCGFPCPPTGVRRVRCWTDAIRSAPLMPLSPTPHTVGA